jgi:hypothetical protein
MTRVRKEIPMKIRKIEQIKEEGKKDNGLKVKTRVKAGGDDEIALCG